MIPQQLATLSTNEVEVLSAQLLEEIETQNELAESLLALSRGVLTNDIENLDAQSGRVGAAVERAENVAKRRQKTLTLLFKRCGLDAKRSRLGELIESAPPESQELLRRLHDTLKEVARRVRRTNTRNHVLIRDMSVLNQQLIFSVLGQSNQVERPHSEFGRGMDQSILDRRI